MLLAIMARGNPSLLTRIGALLTLSVLAGAVLAGRALAAPEVLEPNFTWNAIGRVNVPHGFCTGTLVGPSEVLTVAHCLFHPRQRRLYDPEEVHFVAGWRRGAFVAHARAASFRTAPGLTFGADGAPTRLEDDWAVLRLERALLDLDLLQPLPVGRPRGASQADRAAQLLGYARDRPHLPVRLAPCPIEAAPGRPGLVLHGCVAARGLSGAPVLVPAGSSWSVVAVHLGSVLVDGRRLGVAVPVQRAVPAGAFRRRRRVGAAARHRTGICPIARQPAQEASSGPSPRAPPGPSRRAEPAGRCPAVRSLLVASAQPIRRDPP